MPPTRELLIRPHDFGGRVLRSHKLVVAHIHLRTTRLDQEFTCPRSTSDAAIRAVARCWVGAHTNGKVVRVELGHTELGTVTG